MGVSGSGKSTVAEALCRELGWHFYDADSFHSQANRDKMRAGIALTDADREPWLEALAALQQAAMARNESAALACSALKDSYRRRLGQGQPGVGIVYLKGSQQEIWARLQGRQGHFMNPTLLASQFETLEEPQGALTLDIQLTTEEKIIKIRQAFLKEG